MAREISKAALVIHEWVYIINRFMRTSTCTDAPRFAFKAGKFFMPGWSAMGKFRPGRVPRDNRSQTWRGAPPTTMKMLAQGEREQGCPRYSRLGSRRYSRGNFQGRATAGCSAATRRGDVSLSFRRRRRLALQPDVPRMLKTRSSG